MELFNKQIKFTFLKNPSWKDDAFLQSYVGSLPCQSVLSEKRIESGWSQAH